MSAGIYALRSGFEATICEQHSMAGGMCTSWRRKGYLIEGAVHWLTGSSPKSALYQLWKETGALNENTPVLLPEVFNVMEWEGKNINLYRYIEKTAKEFYAISPGDKRLIRRLVKDVKAFVYFQMPVVHIKGVKTQNPRRMKIGAILGMLPALPRLVKLNKISCRDYAMQFSHHGIQTLLRIVPDEYSAVSLVGTLATLDIGDGAYPKGGSLAIVERMVKTFEGLGGKLLLNTAVKKVNVEQGVSAAAAGNIATGVRLENGTVLNADAVIVAAETIAALERLFDTPPDDSWLSKLCRNTKSSACTFIGVGIRANLPDPLPGWILAEPIKYAGMTETYIRFNNYCNYEAYAPEGCTVLTTALMGDTWEFWKKAQTDGRYEEEKQALADQISRVICQKYPQAEGKIEVMDIATPLTYERYTGAYHGSWMSITGAGDKMQMYPGDSKNVSGLYFAGHRLIPPGGLPVALYTGFAAAQMACRQFGLVFI